jgi:hypothetical protein
MAGTWLELNASSSIGVADAVKNAKLVRCLFPLAALRGPTPGDSLLAMWGFGGAPSYGSYTAKIDFSRRLKL